uniref:Uncharacterized protein n=1 Tax=Knipowitschia caucasica TaxID=637954 RepID=A0AAV2KYQ0_KNICA
MVKKASKRLHFHTALKRRLPQQDLLTTLHTGETVSGVWESPSVIKRKQQSWRECRRGPCALELPSPQSRREEAAVTWSQTWVTVSTQYMSSSPRPEDRARRDI